MCVSAVDKPSITDEVIRMIKPDELLYEHPKEPFMTTSNSEVYRGVYRGFSVAIKRFTKPVNTKPRSVLRFRTMKSCLHETKGKNIEITGKNPEPRCLSTQGLLCQTVQTLLSCWRRKVP